MSEYNFIYDSQHKYNAQRKIFSILVLNKNVIQNVIQEREKRDKRNKNWSIKNFYIQKHFYDNKTEDNIFFRTNRIILLAFTRNSDAFAE